MRRPTVISVALSVFAMSGFGLSTAAGAGGRGTLTANFSEQLVSIDSCPGGVCHVVISGSGKLRGFGPATETVTLTQDRTTTPCGPGSATETYSRRITVAAGTLALSTTGV